MTRGKPPAELQKRRQAIRDQQNIPDKTWFDWKFWSGIALAVIALWLTVEDRPTVSMGPPRNPNDIFSTEVTMVNGGVFPITDVSFAIFDKSVQFGGGDRYDDNVMEEDFAPPMHTLKPGEPVTQTFGDLFDGGEGIPFMSRVPKDEHGVPFPVKSVDVALIAKFCPVWAPFWSRTRTFRFRSVQTKAGLILEQVPAGDIEAEYLKAKGH
jgi:hypothetical protein